MNQLFDIFTISAADAEKIAQAPNNPHHHDFEELIIGIEGRLEHFIDFKNEQKKLSQNTGNHAISSSSHET